MSYNTYFDAEPVLNKFPKAITYLFLSDRSDGKTFNCKARGLKNKKKLNRTFIYLRRYKSEITQKMYETFLDEVLSKKEYEEYKRIYDFRYSKNGVEVKYKNEKDNWTWLCYFIPLSTAGKLKSQLSVENIYEIDYDEFFPLDNRYLPDEIDTLLEFYKSIDRDRGVVKLCIFGNKITPFNPIFDYFNIQLDINNAKIRSYKEGALVVQIYTNEEHKEERAKSRFASLVKGTKYENYDSGGILNALNIKQMSAKGLEYYCSFKTNKGEGSLWYQNDKLVISERIRKDGILIVDNIYNTPNRQEFIATYGKFPNFLKVTYRTGNLFCESERAWHLFEDILKKAGSK